MPPAIQSFLEAPEQVLLNEQRATVHHAAPSGSSSTPKFHPMTGRKRTFSDGGAGGDDDDDDDDGDEDDEDAGGRAGGAGGDGGATAKGKNPRKRNSTSTGRRKIEITYIDNKAKRHVSFTKRKAGLMKKAYELSTLTGTECLIVVVSETGLVYTYATPSLKAIVDLDRGREFIGLALKGELRDDDKPLDQDQDDQTEQQQQQQQQQQQRLPSMDLDVDDVLVQPRAPSAGASGDYYTIDSLYPAGSSGPSDAPLPSPPYGAIPTGYAYPDAVYPFASRGPQPLPDASQSQSQPQAQSQAHSQIQAPAPTPFEHALTSHKLAFDTYTARASEGYSAPAGVHGAHQFSDVARNWKLPRHAPTEDGKLGPTLDTILPGAPPPRPRTSMDERRNTARGEHGASLLEAKANQTIVNYVKAHQLQVIAQRTILPAPGELESSSPPPGIETTLCLFRNMCEDRHLISPSDLKWASQQFLENYLPSQNYSQKKLHESRQHLALFFDYLEGNGLLSPDVHMDLTSFSFAPAPISSSSYPLPPHSSSNLDEGVESRAALVASKLRTWVNGHNSGAPDAAVHGVFAVYRIRSNFCLLSNADANPSLTPFKVRLPRDLTPYLKMDDVISLSITPSDSGSSWVPFRFADFRPSPNPDAEESDIDPSAYEVELERLRGEPRSEENEKAIEVAGETWGMLTRAIGLLEEGDVLGAEG